MTKGKIDTYKGEKLRVVLFACNWCMEPDVYMDPVKDQNSGVDLTPIRIMCTGRINPSFILQAFELGASGVFILGCHKRDCHYEKGNEVAEENIKKSLKLIEILGIERIRVKFHRTSPGAIEEFVREYEKFISKVNST